MQLMPLQRRERNFLGPEQLPHRTGIQAAGHPVSSCGPS